MAGENKIYLFAPNDVQDVPNGTPSPRFTMDLVEDFTPVFSSEITKYKVSDKSYISNHRFRDNLTISLSGLVSTRPLVAYTNNLVAYNDLRGRPKNAYELIKRYEKEGTELTVVNKFDVYTQCLIKSYTPIQIGDDAILINLSLEQVKRASYQRVSLVGTMSDNKKKDANPNVRKNDKKEEIVSDSADGEKPSEDQLTQTQKWKRNNSKTYEDSQETEE